MACTLQILYFQIGSRAHGFHWTDRETGEDHTISTGSEPFKKLRQTYSSQATGNLSGHPFQFDGSSWHQNNFMETGSMQVEVF